MAKSKKTSSGGTGKSPLEKATLKATPAGMAEQDSATADGVTDEEQKQGMGTDTDPDVIRKKFDDYAKQLEDGEMKEAKNAWVMAHKTKVHTNQSLERAKALHNVIVDAQHEYNTLNRDIVLSALQEKDDLTASVGVYKTLYADLSKGLQDACVAIKDINKKMIAVKNAANQLEQDVKDTCNQKDANDLQSKLTLGLGVKNKEGKERTATFNMAVKNLHNQADYSLQDTVEIFNAAVKAAGISALLNLDGLDASIKEVGANIDNLVKDVTTNIKAIAEMAAKQTETYEKGIKANQQALDGRNQKGTHLGALEETIQFVRKGHAELRAKRLRFEMDDLQKKVKEELEL